MKRFFWAPLVIVPMLLSACLPAAIRMAEITLQQAFESRRGLIAYVGEDGNVYTIDPAGATPTAVTTDAIPQSIVGPFQIYRHLAWSPEGLRLAFVGLGGMGEQVDQAVIHIADADGGGLRETFVSADERPIYLFWSPDGRRLSFLSSKNGRDDLALQVVSADEHNARMVDQGQPYYWDWEPGGDRLFVHVGGAVDGRLAFLSLGDEIEEQSIDARPTIFQSPAWSPDGRSLLFAIHKRVGEGALVVADSQGEIRQELVSLDGATAFAWSPDGRRVAYLTNSGLIPFGLYGRLHILDLDDPAAALETQSEVIDAFFWAPDGRSIAYLVPVRLDSTFGAAWQPEPEVLQALFVMDVPSGKARRLAVFNPTDEFLALIPFFDQYHRSLTLWSPDSQELVYAALDGENRPGVWVVSAAGDRPPRLLAPGVVGVWSW